MATKEKKLLGNRTPFYSTIRGAAYVGDALDLLRDVPDCSVDLVMTSPPFALQRKKSYGNVPPEEYVDWIRPFAQEIQRVLAEEGSFVLDLGGSWNRGQPTKSLYNYKVLIDLVENVGFYLAQEFFWYNPARLPSPAEWVTVRRIRVKDAVNTIWWLSKSPFPKADNREILREYSNSMKDLLKKGYKPKLRPSGHDISTKFGKDNNGSIPPNLLEIANTESNSLYLRKCKDIGIKPHPARYPRAIPELFIRFLTSEGDLVLDPFCGSNVTGEAADDLNRRWLSFELREDYLFGSAVRLATSEGFSSRVKSYLTLFD